MLPLLSGSDGGYGFLSRSSRLTSDSTQRRLFQEALEAYMQRVLRRMNSAKADTGRVAIECVCCVFAGQESFPPAGCA